jgi:hypothetical protein
LSSYFQDATPADFAPPAPLKKERLAKIQNKANLALKEQNKGLMVFRNSDFGAAHARPRQIPNEPNAADPLPPQGEDCWRRQSRVVFDAAKDFPPARASRML